MNYETWTKTYSPVKNEFDLFAGYGGTMFETYGDELDFLKGVNQQQIWTLRSGDGVTSITPGYGWINRLGYFVTEKPWTNTNDEIIICEEVECDCYKEDGYIDLFGETQDGDPKCEKCEGYGRYDKWHD